MLFIGQPPLDSRFVSMQVCLAPNCTISKLEENTVELKHTSYRTVLSLFVPETAANSEKQSDEIIEAIKGYNIGTDQAKKLELARGHLEYLDDMITQTEVELYARIKPYYEFVNFVSTMPGMTELSSTVVLAETGVDMDVFDDAKRLCSWCGLSPANNESAGKKKSVRIAKAGAYLKPLMVQCALAAVKSKKQPYFAIKYGRIKKRRGTRKQSLPLQE